MKKGIDETNHRTRVGALRRQKMRERLLVGALSLVANGGTKALTVDNVIAKAEVSRGTFYKYYDTPAALMQDLAVDITNSLIRHAEPIVRNLSDPVERVATGVRVIMHACAKHPELGQFVVSLGWPNMQQSELLFSYVRRDIRAAQGSGAFIAMPLELAVSLVAGTTIGGIQLMLSRSRSRHIPEQSTAALLRSLGIEVQDASKISQIPIEFPSLASVELLWQAAK